MLQLPSELISEIALRIPSREGSQYERTIVSGKGGSHRSLSLVCRRLRNIVAPLLFESVQVEVPFLVDQDQMEKTLRILNMHASARKVHIRTMTLAMVYPSGVDTPEEYSVIDRFMSQVLESTPTLQTLTLAVPRNLSIHPFVQQAIRLHPQLVRATLPDLRLDRNSHMPLFPLEGAPKAQRNVAVVVVDGMLDCYEGDESEDWTGVTAWKTLYDWGVSVEDLELRSLYDLCNSDWSTATFRGLRSLMTDNAHLFPSAGTAGSFEDFIQRHPSLRNIVLGNLSQLGKWPDDVPHITVIPRICNETPWRATKAILSQNSALSSFHCHHISVMLTHDIHSQRSLVFLDHAFRELGSIYVTMGAPTNSDGGVFCGFQETRTILSDMVRSKGSFQQLATLKMEWVITFSDFKTTAEDKVLEEWEDAPDYMPLTLEERKSSSERLEKLLRLVCQELADGLPALKCMSNAIWFEQDPQHFHFAFVNFKIHRFIDGTSPRIESL